MITLCTRSWAIRKTGERHDYPDQIDNIPSSRLLSLLDEESVRHLMRGGIVGLNLPSNIFYQYELLNVPISLKTTSWYVRPSGEKRGVESHVTKDMPQSRLDLILSDEEIKSLKKEGHVTVKMIGEVYVKHEII